MNQTILTEDIELTTPQVVRLFSQSDVFTRLAPIAVSPFRIQISPHAGGVRLVGDGVAVKLVAEMLLQIGEALAAGSPVGDDTIEATISRVVQAALKHELAYRLNGLPHALRPMSLSQVAFMNALRSAERPLIFGVGPAGTGKTHLAVAAGLNQVAEKRFKSLIVTRPRVLLEGEIMTPALRAETQYDEQLTLIEDVLHDLLGPDEIKRQTDHGLIQVMPLGRMRGRTFNESFILVDEAQNMTVRKMRMVLTRLGRASNMVITGDPSQTDLPGDEPSGLAHILGLISETNLALIYRFQNQQIIRNDLVARIEALYARDDGVPDSPTTDRR